jgi:hypothetical protein
VPIFLGKSTHLCHFRVSLEQIAKVDKVTWSFDLPRTPSVAAFEILERKQPDGL